MRKVTPHGIHNELIGTLGYCSEWWCDTRMRVLDHGAFGTLGRGRCQVLGRGRCQVITSEEANEKKTFQKAFDHFGTFVLEKWKKNKNGLSCLWLSLYVADDVRRENIPTDIQPHYAHLCSMFVPYRPPKYGTRIERGTRNVPKEITKEWGMPPTNDDGLTQSKRNVSVKQIPTTRYPQGSGINRCPICSHPPETAMNHSA